MPSFERKGPDNLQKLFLYLIIFDWIALLYLASELTTLSFRQGVSTSIMLATFNCILFNICLKRTRRSNDSYLIYPVIAAALLSFILIAYFFLFT